MDATGQLAHLTTICAAVSDLDDAGRTDDAVRAVLPPLRVLAGAAAVLLARRHGEELLEVGRDAEDTGSSMGGLRVADLWPALPPAAGTDRGRLNPVAVPPTWAAVGVTGVSAQLLSGHTGVLLLAWTGEEDLERPALLTGLALLDAALGRVQAERELADLSARVDNAQQLADMGDYDWHIASDTNRWSDQLYRIYGHEPQSFNPSYERFLGLIHPEDRERISAVHQQAYATGEAYHMIERIVRPDGEVRHLSSNGEVVLDADGTPVRMRGTCIDVTDRVLAEEERAAQAARLGEAQLRRRQALEINDNVVQGLVAATYAREAGQHDVGGRYLEQTLRAARTMMDDLLEPLDGEGLQPGDLVRSSAATLGQPVETPPAPASAPAQAPPTDRRVLVVDDAEDLRTLVRLRVERVPALTVVGEAGDGEEAVEQARALQPDLVLLDLAMPRMDGLEALPLIKEAVPGVRVIVLSGFNQSSLAERAIAAGADRYVVKGGSLRELVDQVREVMA